MAPSQWAKVKALRAEHERLARERDAFETALERSEVERTTLCDVASALAADMAALRAENERLKSHIVAAVDRLGCRCDDQLRLAHIDAVNEANENAALRAEVERLRAVLLEIAGHAHYPVSQYGAIARAALRGEEGT
jgi:predicted  nucleic acid-binding Zn-ribbon protein